MNKSSITLAMEKMKENEEIENKLVPIKKRINSNDEKCLMKVSITIDADIVLYGRPSEFKTILNNNNYDIQKYILDGYQPDFETISTIVLRKQDVGSWELENEPYSDTSDVAGDSTKNILERLHSVIQKELDSNEADLRQLKLEGFEDET